MLIIVNGEYTVMIVVDGETWILYNPDEYPERKDRDRCGYLWGRKSTIERFQDWLEAIHS